MSNDFLSLQILEELKAIRILLEENSLKGQMWKRLSEEGTATIGVKIGEVTGTPNVGTFIDGHPLPELPDTNLSYIKLSMAQSKEPSAEERETLRAYMEKERNLLSPFEREVVKLTIAEEPLVLICEHLNRHEKSISNALLSALSKATREAELEKSNDVMKHFIGTNVAWTDAVKDSLEGTCSVNYTPKRPNANS